MGLSLITLYVLYITFLVSPFVRGSTKFFSDCPNSRAITPLFISSLTMLCLSRMCLFFPLYTLLFARAIAACESQCNEIDRTGFSHIGILARDSLAIHLHYLPFLE
ncbi:hypothetical protein CsSME_00051395 [Camellia sinensis var. sinensis]